MHHAFTHSPTYTKVGKFVKQNAIDVVVLSEDFPRHSGFQIGSVSDWVRQNIICPFIIVRASAVRNERLRLASQSSIDVASPPKAHSLGTSPFSSTSNTVSTSQQQHVLSPDSAPGRKVAIAYSTYPVGTHLMELAKQLVLLPQDEIYVVHCFGDRKSGVIEQTKNLLLRTITLGLSDSTPSSTVEALATTIGNGGQEATTSPGATPSGLPTNPQQQQASPSTTPPLHSEDVTEESSLSFGAKELAGYKEVHLGVVLKGDPRTSLVSFCASEGIELLVISTRLAGFIRKTLSGGSVSGYLIDKAPCPCLVAPLKFLGMASEEDGGGSGGGGGNNGTGGALSPMTMTHGEGTSMDVAEWGVGGSSPVSPMSPSQSTVVLDELRGQLAEKDKIIAALREELAKFKTTT